MELYNRPLEVIFNLLCVCRRGFDCTLRGLREALRKKGLFFSSYENLPRLPFWISICRTASLLDDDWPPYPTLLVEEWLAVPPVKQIQTLVRAWLSEPAHKRQRTLRERVIDKLACAGEISTTFQRELRGLRALGVCEGNLLTVLGQSVVAATLDCSRIETQAEPWRIIEDNLYVPFPPDWLLLWKLEAYLDPVSPGVYRLRDDSLQRAAGRGTARGSTGSALIDIIGKGMGQSVPDDLGERLAAVSAIRILPGPVLAFEDPRELIKLREGPSFRRELNDLLTPRHVHLDPWLAPRILSRLFQKGLIHRRNLEMALALHPALRMTDGVLPERAGLSKAERIYLLALLIAAEGMNAVHDQPPGLLLKLTAGLDLASRAAAAKKALEITGHLAPNPVWIPEEEPPPEPEGDLIVFIEQAIERGETIDVIYKAYGRAEAEYRRLTPLLVEQRGARHYLLAYCHLRRENRTFRLDRLSLIDFPPEM